MAPCLWFGVTRDEVRVINRHMRDEKLANRNRGEVLGHWLDIENMGRARSAREPHTSLAATEPRGSIRASKTDRGVYGLRRPS